MSQEVITYREMAVRTSSPVETVIMLCDFVIRDLKKVVGAIRMDDIEERVRQSNRVLLALQELDLMLDFENGGNTAKELARVYSYVRAKVVESQIKLDPAILERQIEFILQLREAWQKAVATEKLSASSLFAPELPASAAGASYPRAGVGEEAQSCSWSA